MSKGKIALGAVVGMAAGLVAGFLTAPKSGKETRADLKAKANELKVEADKKAKEVMKQGDKVLKDTKSTVEDLRGRTERAVDAAKNEFKS